jgi:hypothetical protein
MSDVIVINYGDYLETTGQIFDSVEYHMYMKHSGIDSKLAFMCNAKTLMVYDKLLRDKYDVKIDYDWWGKKKYPEKSSVYFFSSSHMAADFLKQVYPYCETIVTTRVVPDYINKKDDEAYLQRCPTPVVMLEDRRLYSKKQYSVSFNHKRKIYFSIMKKPEKPEDKTLLMLNGYRAIPPEEVLGFIRNEKSVLLLTKDDQYDELADSRIEVKRVPIENFHEQFNKLIYTPLNRKFDPSPRTIAESALFGKKIQVEDFGQIAECKDGGYYRIIDITDDIDSLKLENDTQFINLIKGLV